MEGLRLPEPVQGTAPLPTAPAAGLGHAWHSAQRQAEGAVRRQRLSLGPAGASAAAVAGAHQKEAGRRFDEVEKEEEEEGVEVEGAPRAGVEDGAEDDEEEEVEEEEEEEEDAFQELQPGEQLPPMEGPDPGLLFGSWLPFRGFIQACASSHVLLLLMKGESPRSPFTMDDHSKIACFHPFLSCVAVSLILRVCDLGGEIIHQRSGMADGNPVMLQDTQPEFG
eukprot:scaffold136173_cov17-Tisochrysis_lutea.AAC.1